MTVATSNKTIIILIIHNQRCFFLAILGILTAVTGISGEALAGKSGSFASSLAGNNFSVGGGSISGTGLSLSGNF